MSKDPTRITIHDIARELGLHASTVSRALNDNPAVSKKTRALIKAKAQELNYRPNQMASALRRGRSDTLGVIVPAIDRHFFSSVIRGIEEEADQAGLHVVVCQSYDDSGRERKLLSGLQAMRVDGILMSTAKDGINRATYYDGIVADGTPIQFFDNMPTELNAAAVVINDRRGAYLATRHLIQLGRTTIAHLRGPQHLDIYKDRYAGYRDAMEEAGLPITDDLLVGIVSHFDKVRASFDHLWSLRPRVDAVFSSSDYSAAGAMQSALNFGLRIPEDVAFVGFANEPFTTLMTPTLSSVDQQPIAMGRRAAGKLLRYINEGAAQSDRVVLEPRVIIRKSSY